MSDAPSNSGRFLAQSRLRELLEDAASPLQVELLKRGIAAGRSVGELHAFGDAIRGMTDAALFEAFTVNSTKGNLPLQALLAAQADPLAAFVLSGGVLTPSAEPVTTAAPVKRTTQKTFMGDSEPTQPHRVLRLNSSDLNPATVSETDLSTLQSALNSLCRGLNVSWTVYDVGAGQKMSVAEALQRALVHIDRGLCIPFGLRPLKGSGLGYLLALQVRKSPTGTAIQLLDIASSETSWVHEGDVLHGRELPFADKRLRMVCRTALPEVR
jgi:hypothetical protein